MSITGALGVVMKPQQKDLLPRKDIQNYQRGRENYACIFFDMVQGRKDGVNVNIESKHIKLLKTSAFGEWSMGLWEKSWLLQNTSLVYCVLILKVNSRSQ